MASLFSSLATTAGAWNRPVSNYATIAGSVGHGSASNRDAAMTALSGVTVHSPTVLAFQLNSDPHRIYIGYHPTIFVADIHNPTPFDNHILVLVGDDLDTAMGLVLNSTTFGRAANHGYYNRAYLKGADGYGRAAGANYDHERQAAGTPDTDAYQCRRFVVLPPNVAPLALTEASEDGYMSLQGFENLILTPEIDSGDAARVATIGEVVQFWRGCHHHAPGHADQRTIGTTHVAGTTPAHERALQVRTNMIRNDLLAKLGVGGPGLTTAAFNTGVNALRNQMDQDAQAALQYQRDKDNKSFTDRHGAQLATRLWRWCNVTSDAALPEVHRLLAKSDGKARDYGIIQAAVEARVLASPVPLSMVNAPMVTTSIVEEIFRQYQPCHPGLTFGKGLSPFSMVCHGHPEQHAVSRALEKARIATSGAGSVSLADASTLLTSDVRFPIPGPQGAQKGYAWSIYADVYHGENHDVCISIRNFVNKVGPVFESIQNTNAENPAAGMDLICRVLFEAQQDYFSWMAKVGANDRTAVIPTFDHLIDRVLTHRVSGLSMLPASWYLMIQAGAPQVSGSSTSSSSSTAGNAGVTRVPTFNSWADESLMERFRGSRFQTVSELLEAASGEEPKVNGKSVCLTWALKGTCSAKCKRGKQHSRYPPAVVKKLHQFLTDAGVSPSVE